MSSSQGSFPFRERNPVGFVPHLTLSVLRTSGLGDILPAPPVADWMARSDIFLEEVAARGPVASWQICNKCRSAVLFRHFGGKSPRNPGFSPRTARPGPCGAPLPGGVPLPKKNPKFRKIPGPRGALGFWGSKLFEFPVTVQKFSPRNFPRRDLTSI